MGLISEVVGTTKELTGINKKRYDRVARAVETDGLDGHFADRVRFAYKSTTMKIGDIALAKELGE